VNSLAQNSPATYVRIARYGIGLVEIRDFTTAGWLNPALAEQRGKYYCERLEEGETLFFEESPFVLSGEDRAFLLTVRQAGSSLYKNISYRPSQGRVRGFAKGSVDEKRLARVLGGYSQRLVRSVSLLLAPYARSWQLDFASFRPFEERGRKLPLKARNDLIHVDSFPTRPTRGNRILRVFTNLHPTRPRVWVTTDSLEVLAMQMARGAGLAEIAAENGSLLHRVGAWLARVACRVGVPVPNRSAYDRFMLNFHHYLKANQAFQDSCAKSKWEFPPNSSWVVFTDMVPHAVLAGQFAMEQTFIVSRDALLFPEKAPVRILERICGRPLA